VKVDIPRVIKALEESQNDPNKAVRSLTAEAEEREGEAEALRQVASAIRLLTGDGPTATSNGAVSASPPRADTSDEPPKGMDAVRRIMRGGGVYTGRSMLEELTRRGWEPKDAKHPLATVEAAMDRLFRVKKEIDRVGRGEYTMKGHPASPSLETLGEYGS
jgi:hypothetical protein